MATAEKNTVVAGDYAGAEVKLSTKSKYAFVAARDGLYFNKLYVKSVKEANASTENDYAAALAGQMVFGAAGTVMGANQKVALLEVEWKDGKRSLIKVDSDIQQAITIGMYDNVTEKSQEKIKQGDISHNNKMQIVYLVIFAISIYIYVIAPLFK